ncbi:MAG TPA: DUF502 domain-containing protein [Burkholderiales bacterium]|nr:DUF502 domain-containing protein [Burkholderiales bacterium]
MKSLGKILFTGVLTVLPILATVYLVIWLLAVVEDILGTPLQWLIPETYYRTGMGLALAIVLVFVVGMLMRAYIVQRIFGWFEGLVLGVPLVKSVYSALRDFFGLFQRREGEEAALQVVSLQIPGTDMRMLGFITRTDFSDVPEGIGGEGEVAVYLPMSYQIGGYTIFLPRESLTPIAMSREEAMKFVLTAGVKMKSAQKNGV